MYILPMCLTEPRAIDEMAISVAITDIGSIMQTDYEVTPISIAKLSLSLVCFAVG